MNHLDLKTDLQRKRVLLIIIEGIFNYLKTSIKKIVNYFFDVENPVKKTSELDPLFDTNDIYDIPSLLSYPKIDKSRPTDRNQYNNQSSRNNKLSNSNFIRLNQKYDNFFELTRQKICDPKLITGKKTSSVLKIVNYITSITTIKFRYFIKQHDNSYKRHNKKCQGNDRIISPDQKNCEKQEYRK